MREANTPPAFRASDTGGAAARGPSDLLSAWLFRRPRVVLALLLVPPLLWFGVVYLGSLSTLLVQSFFALDDFTGQVVRELTLDTWKQFCDAANVDIVLRTIGMAASVTVASALLAFPLAWATARATGRVKGVLYLGIMLPLWSSYLVRLYAWKLILAREGIVSWAAAHLGLGGALDAFLSLPVVGGPSLSASYAGMFLVFVYMWLPYMVLPVQAALERVPPTLVEAAADLGSTPRQTFRHVIFPLALPGVVAGSIFTFSLTLGDYIIPGVIGQSNLFLGQAVLLHQGTAGNIPLAAAFSVVPMVVMAVYLTAARKMGAFDAL